MAEGPTVSIHFKCMDCKHREEYTVTRTQLLNSEIRRFRCTLLGEKLMGGCDTPPYCPFILDAAEKVIKKELQSIRNERMKKALE